MDIFRLAERSMAMDDASWARHANPWSVFSRFAILPLLALAVWSRVWLGWGALLPVAAVIVFTFVNPRLFAPVEGPPRGWAGRGTAGERLWLKRRSLALPRRHLIIGNILALLSGLGLLLYGWALWALDLKLLLLGMVWAMAAKTWFVDRMARLYDEIGPDVAR
ncbi:DUF6653 family protein [Frigidibacter sp. ROC022]|uniref:DUF6653 family protein n=1 Tax=Frigidibacter sp. ROC022 TaxID=2971796 RepID=UPI00215B2C52|nr:DUF6653 family protein [Frigidibacter sp. ROC022]MCR8722934.1 hypothetical protein [Frigidibacter sp. ROC022]